MRLRVVHLDVCIRNVALRGLGSLPFRVFRVEHSLVVLPSPLVLHQEVALENRLNHEVVFFVPLLEQILLHNCQLSLIDSDEAALSFGNSHLLTYLEISVKKDFFAEGPAYVDTPYQMLRSLRQLRHVVSLCVVSAARHRRLSI